MPSPVAAPGAFGSIVNVAFPPMLWTAGVPDVKAAAGRRVGVSPGISFKPRTSP